MKHTERLQKSPVYEPWNLQQCLEALDLTPTVRHTLALALSQDVEQVQHCLAQQAQQAERLLLLGEMAAKLTHEIRNFLYAIFLNADILEEEICRPTPDSQTQMTESLSTMRTEVTRLYDMVQDYLMLVRLSGLQCEPAALETVLHDTVLEVQEQAHIQGVALRLEGLVSLGCVSLHQSTLRHALLSLLRRALRAMPQGGTLIVQGHRTTSQVVLEIRDTGTSIPHDPFNLPFEPYHVTGSAWTGLGVYLVREIIAAHGGTVTVQSAPGHGTTYTMTFPLLATASRTVEHPEAGTVV